MGIKDLKITKREILTFIITAAACSLIILSLMLSNVIQINTYGRNGDYILLFTAISALSTLVYAVLSLKLVEETAKSASLSSQLVEETRKARELSSELVDESRKAREFQIQPFISLYIVGRTGFIDTFVQNDGLGGAKNIKFTSDIDIQNLPDRKMSELGYFKEGIEYLPPKSSIRIATTYLFDDKSKMNIKQNITVKYKDILDKPYERTILLNYAEFEGYIPVKTSLDKSLENISDNLKQIKNEIADLQERPIREIRTSLEEVSEIDDNWAKYLSTIKESN